MPKRLDTAEVAGAPKAPRRRQLYAEQTRTAILNAARELFSEKGYFSTTVDDIAEMAGVAAVTVYVSAGGKSGLLRKLTDLWTTAPIIEANHKIIIELTDPVEVLRVVASTARNVREEFGDIVILMLATAPHDKDVSENLARATTRYRKLILGVVRRLNTLHALAEGTSESHAVDVLWFYFGYWGLYSLHVENGWDYDTAEKWLWNAAVSGLLQNDRPEVSRSGRKSRTRTA